ncbi:MAG: DNA-processing protein DprA [Armatimonadetes bacterium]|nr:DNA-processing protein DprA [Armatimonadota bacterium]
MIARIERGDSDYPAVLRDRLGDDAPPCLYAMGDAAMLRHQLLGLVCSVQCPGSVVIKTLDAIRALRDAGVAVIGGFHSPMERECLDILLRGDQPVIFCPARRLAGLRIGRIPRRAVKEGRLLVLSPFAESFRRTTAAQAIQRNNLVAALADAVWVPHAAPGGKTWATVHTALERRQQVFAFDDEANKSIREIGARPFSEFMDKLESKASFQRGG